MTNTNNNANNNNNITTNTINIALAMPGNRKSLLVVATIENLDLSDIKTRYDSVDDIYGNGYPFHMEKNKNLAKVRSEIFQSIFEIDNDVIGIEDIKNTNAKALVFRNNLRLIIGNFSYYDIKMNYKDFLASIKCATRIEEITFDAAKEINNLIEEVVYITLKAKKEIDEVVLLENK